MLDNLTMGAFVHQVESRIRGVDTYAHPDRFFISSRLAHGHLAPKPDDRFPFDIWYGYPIVVVNTLILLGQDRLVMHRGHALIVLAATVISCVASVPKPIPQASASPMVMW